MIVKGLEYNTNVLPSALKDYGFDNVFANQGMPELYVFPTKDHPGSVLINIRNGKISIDTDDQIAIAKLFDLFAARLVIRTYKEND